MFVQGEEVNDCEPFVVDDGINHWPNPSSKLFPQALDSEYPCLVLIAGKTPLFSEHQPWFICTFKFFSDRLFCCMLVLIIFDAQETFLYLLILICCFSACVYLVTLIKSSQVSHLR